MVRRSLNTSRENSYERTDESHSAGLHSSREQEADPLYYNSRPPNKSQQSYPYQANAK
jgi:hypothetical protein